MKQSLSYIAQHMHETGLYWLDAFKDDDMVRARVVTSFRKSEILCVYKISTKCEF